MEIITPAEDFWSRQTHAQAHTLMFDALDASVTISANTANLLNAARLSAGRFSQPLARDVSARPIRIQSIERAQTGEPPTYWPEQLVYAGTSDWISLSAGALGYGVGQRLNQEALVVLDAALSRDAILVSRYFFDHYILNFLFNGWAMLHASCVVDAARQKLVAFIGAHNIGKSTAALQLLRAGWHFLADGMLLIRNDSSPHQFEIGGYPIGEVKLRDDVLALFPEYAGEKVRVREQRKTVVNLRAVHPERVVENVLTPREIHLCFAERSETSQTSLASIAIEAARERVAHNTVYWDEPPMLKRNSKILLGLLATARLHHLRLGTNTTELLTLLESL